MQAPVCAYGLAAKVVAVSIVTDDGDITSIAPSTVIEAVNGVEI
jgi:hypothetical protein